MYDLREVPGLRLKFVCTVLLWLTNTPMSLAIGTRIKDMTTEISSMTFCIPESHYASIVC
jgi:hypothetical protein